MTSPGQPRTTEAATTSRPRLVAAAAWLGLLGWLPARRRRVLLTLGVVSIFDCLLMVLGAAHSQYGAAIGPGWGVFLTLATAIGVVVLARDPATGQSP